MLVEQPFVSDRFRFGGTIDCLAKIDGQLVLLDFKTSKGIFPEMLIQLAAYNQLLAEAGHITHHAMILRIGRDADEGFEERHVTALAQQWELFTHCLAIYRLQNEIKRGS